VDRALLYSDALDGDLLEVWEMKSIDILFFREHSWTYISLREKQSTTQPQLRRSLAEQTTPLKPKKTKEKKACRDRPDEPTKPVGRQPDRTKDKVNQAKHDYLNL
jgi:hypothetical protein